MKLRVLALTALVLPLCGCRGASGEEPVVEAAPPVLAASSPATEVGSPPQADPAVADPSLAGRTLTRTIERDANNDGIPESRVFITETFDANGRLQSRTREVDRDADGIIDSKTVTDFD